MTHADSASDELHAAQLLESLATARYQASTRTPPDRAQLESVAQIYENLAQKYPRDATVREAYGSFFWQIEQHAKAAEQWQIGEKLDPKNADIVFHLGAAFLETGQVKRALEYFTRASQLAPQDALFHFHLGNALFLFRHEMIDPAHPDAEDVSRRAMMEFQKAAELAPLNPEYLKSYAEVFYTLRTPDWALARAAWQRYLEAGGSRDLAYSHLARVCLKMGLTEEARHFASEITGQDFQRVRDRLLRQIEEKNALPASSPRG